MYYVYILKWTKYYCGCTKNLEKRVKEHLNWEVRTTKILKINELVWYLEATDEKEWFELERRIKKSKNIKKWINKSWFIKVNKILV